MDSVLPAATTAAAVRAVATVNFILMKVVEGGGGIVEVWKVVVEVVVVGVNGLIE